MAKDKELDQAQAEEEANMEAARLADEAQRRQAQVDEDWPEQPSTEVAEKEPRIVNIIDSAGVNRQVGAEELKSLSFDQLADFFGGTIVTSDEAIGTDQYGPVLEDKGKLVGTPLLLVHWEFYPGDFGEFVSCWVMTQSGDRYIVNDGSSGIYAQLRELTDKRSLNSGVACKHGLRVSKYDKELPNGNVLRDCETYYVDTKL